jgi:outer membrane protein assembly factor BamB
MRMVKHQFLNLKMAAFVAYLFIHQFVNAQWSQWRGTMRDGFSAETNLLKTWPAEGPALVWSSDKIGAGFATPIINDHIIYVAGTRDSFEMITAFDFSGKILWQKDYGKIKGGQEVSTPTYCKDKIYAFTSSGILSCINPAKGLIDWSINIPDKFKGAIGTGTQFCESPLVTDDKVILTPCGKNTTMIALNSANGETVWTSESLNDSSNYTSPVLIQGNDRKLIVTSTRNHCIAVDLNTGEIVWKEKLKTTYVPLPGTKQVYFSGTREGGKLLNISDDLSSFNFKWCDSLKVKILGGAVRIGNRIFGTFENGTGIFCVDWETGKLITKNNAIKGANLLAADGMIYSYEERGGRVSLLKPGDTNIEIAGSFQVKLGSQAHLAHMSIANSILFVRHGEVLMAYDIKQ